MKIPSLTKKTLPATEDPSPKAPPAKDAPPQKGRSLTSFLMATVLCVLVIAVTGVILLLLEEDQVERQNQQQSAQIATALATELAFFVQTQTSLLEAIVQDPTLVQLFTANDNIALDARAAELTYLFPGALRVRLLRPGTVQTDEKIHPALGYAALALLRETEAGRIPSVEVHLSVGGNRNIAITRPVRDTSDKRILGHVLVQSSVDSLPHLLDPVARGENLVVLVQTGDRREVTLYHKGDNQETATAPNVVRKEIPGTHWRLSYRSNSHGGEDQTLQIGGLLGVIAVVVILAFLWVQRTFNKALNDDLSAIVTTIRELRNERSAAPYSAHFAAVSGTLEVIQRLFQTPATQQPKAKVVTAASLGVLPKQEVKPSLAPPVQAPVDPTPPQVTGATSSPPPSVPQPISAPTPAPVSASPLAAAPATVSAPAQVLASAPPAAPAPTRVAPLPLVLLDLDSAPPEAPTPTLSPPVVSTPSTALPTLGLSLLDLDFSDLAPGNKATVTLPVAAASSSRSSDLSLLNPGFPTPASEEDEEAITYPSDLTSASASLSPEIFRAYDIRGIVDDSLTAEGVYTIGRAIGSEAHERGQQSVVVARDGRVSALRLVNALISGMRATGCNVIDIGQVPTPLLYFATHFLETHAGVMLTASHNPPQWNGMKVVLGGETLSEEGIQRLYQRIEADQFVTGDGNLQTMDVIPEYLSQITTDIQLQRPLRLVVDGGNGVAGALASRLYRSLNCEVEELFCEVDGNFPHHQPDPSQPQNLRDLIDVVKARQADLGIALDGDGDRLVVVAGNGAIIWPDRLMMLFAGDFLPRNPGATVVFDVKSSPHLPRTIKKYGGRPLMWKTGHSLIKAKMKEAGALLGGEMSGHIFFKERWFGFDDGLYAGARLLELLSHHEHPPTDVFAKLPDAAISTPELRLDLPEGESNRLMKALALTRTRITGAEITNIDGLRADFEEGWGLVRASNTTPSLVFRFEASTPQTLRRVQDEFRRILLEVGPGLKLPF
ncbi:phosphomannomutase / phosphoglucomutase [Gammaproteobacteria bacterium]